MAPLRIVIFTRPDLTATNEVLWRRLHEDPAIEVAAIVVDEFPWRTRPFKERLKKYGRGYLGYKIREKISDAVTQRLWAAWRRGHPALAAGASWERLAALGLPIYRTPDIHCEASVEHIRSLGADLGVLCGGRIIKPLVLEIPRRGTLNIHKRKAPEYRGGGRIGYWELKAGEREIGVTIHYAVAKVDEGAILGQRLIPIEPCDTLASLGIKANIAGCELYHEVLAACAAGQMEGTRQDGSKGRTFRSDGEYPEDLFERQLQARQAEAMARAGRRRDYYQSPNLWIKYLGLYPFLAARRRHLEKEGQAPIIALFYHRVANDAATPGTLPLEDFAAQIDLIRRHYPIVSLAEAHRRLASGRNGETAFVITFDDGYAADLATAIPWLRTFDIPATWFISIGHVLEGSPYAHDVRRGVTAARPMTVEELRAIDHGCISIGSHAWLHEDCGKIGGAELERAIRGSREKLEEILGHPVPHFAFPKGIPGANITREGWEMAAATYDVVCSAYGGYNFPSADARHIRRWGNPYKRTGLLPIMDGFRGAGDLVRRDLWGYGRRNEPPY